MGRLQQIKFYINQEMKQDYFWNTTASILNASESIIISAIVSRITGLDDVGYFTIAFAIGNLLLTLGRFGAYTYQVSDTTERFTYSDYFFFKLTNMVLMCIGLFVYVIYSRITQLSGMSKILIILSIGVIYIVEAYEELFKAQCHRNGCLHIGAKLFIIRWVSILTSFFLIDFLFKNSAFAIAFSSIISIVCFMIAKNQLEKIHKINNRIEPPISFKKMYELYYACMPLFLSTFLNSYIINSPKYALDKVADSRTQACYGFISMPVFAIVLFSSFIYIPQIVQLSSDYNTRNIESFKQRYRNQILITILIAIISTLVGFFIGIPILSYIYAVNLNTYKTEFIILLSSGAWLAISSYQTIVLTVIRQQHNILIGYSPVALLSFLFMPRIANMYGTLGASITYSILIFFTCVLFQFFISKSTTHE